jgi:hypothetical protein
MRMASLTLLEVVTTKPKLWCERSTPVCFEYPCWFAFWHESAVPTVFDVRDWEMNGLAADAALRQLMTLQIPNLPRTGIGSIDV